MVGQKHANNEQVDDELVGLVLHLVLVSYVGEISSSTPHTKNLPLWTKPTPLTLASHWASLSLFILSSSYTSVSTVQLHTTNYTAVSQCRTGFKLQTSVEA
jgi:hypothetical protein